MSIDEETLKVLKHPKPLNDNEIIELLDSSPTDISKFLSTQTTDDFISNYHSFCEFFEISQQDEHFKLIQTSNIIEIIFSKSVNHFVFMKIHNNFS